jgi:hypothetical protein
MCDFSLEHLISRKAERGDRLAVYRFSSGTVGVARAGDEACPTCLQPGTELAFDGPIVLDNGVELPHSVAKFTQFEVQIWARTGGPMRHRDGIETPDGRRYSLQDLARDQELRVLQVPAPEPKFNSGNVVLPGEAVVLEDASS